MTAPSAGGHDLRTHWKGADMWRAAEGDAEELPTDTMHAAILDQQVKEVIKLDQDGKRPFMDSIVRVVEQDNEQLLRRLRSRIDRVGIEMPKIEVRYENLCVEGDAYVGTRALPTLLNSSLNAAQSVLGMIGLFPSRSQVVQILKDVSGIIKPSRMTLLMGPPGSGKTTLLKSLAGRLDSDLRVKGRLTYCGHEFWEFAPEATCAYVSQHDLHYGEMTVRETLEFSARCLGVGTRYELLLELLRREQEAGIYPDPAIDAFMKATAMGDQSTTIITDYVLKILGLEYCADIMVGDEMRRGISGGQKKRLTTGEMLVGPAKAFFMDEISCGLDSVTTFQIIEFMRQMVHSMDSTMVISLLQPAPETFQLFDDIILLSEGQIVYHGPRENVLEFLEYVGFRCPDRKSVPDYLQEVTSMKDQEQYWHRKEQPYRYISVAEFVERFATFQVGEDLFRALAVPFDKATTHPAALAKKKYGISNRNLFKACLSREWLLIKRNYFVHIFKTTQITIMAIIASTVFLRTEMKPGDRSEVAMFWGALFFSLVNMMFNGMPEQALTIFRLPVFFKQRNLLYPAWAFALPYWLLRIPTSLVESSIWVILTYYTIGFAPAPSRFFKQYVAFFSVHQMAISLFRFIAALARTQLVANTLGSLALLEVVVLGGFIISKDEMPSWIAWLYYADPMMYGQNAIALNEFLSERWNVVSTCVAHQQPQRAKFRNLPSRGESSLHYKHLVLDIRWSSPCFLAAI